MATILIADDQPMNRQYLVTLLGYFGHRLLEASNGDEAFKLAKSERPSLVISDLMMPIVDGQELAVRMHADPELAQTPILFYSATYSLRQAQAVAREVGAINVLPKPGDPETVLAMIHGALGLESTRLPSSASESSFQPIPPEFAQKLADLEEITHRLATPIEMGLALAAERDPAKLLLGLARMARELIGTRYSSVGLLTEDGGSVRVVVSSGVGKPVNPSEADNPALSSDPKIYPAPERGSVLGELLSDGRAIRLSNVETAKLYLEIPGCSRLDSFLAVPLVSGSSPRGWLLLANKLGGEEFTDGDSRVVSTLAAQGASTYQRARELLRGEEDLRKSKAMYEALFEAAPDAMLATDQQGVIQSANAQTGKMFGYSREELVGQPIDRLMPSRFEAGHAELRQGYFREPRLRPMGSGMDLYGKRKDGGEFPVDIMLSPLETSERRLVLSVVRDITVRRENEKRILELNSQLQTRVEELQTANQSLEAFSYSVSHDLRAPLRAIDGFARIISEDYQKLLNEEGLRLLDVIAAICHKMGKLIEDLLAFSRVSRDLILKSEMDMTTLARSVLEDIRAQEPGRRIETTVRDLPPALGDRNLLRQVYINLISNAWKFTRHAPAPAIEIGSYNDGQRRVYFVKDNGVGFEPKYSHKLFGVFQRLHTEQEFEGTGIGLALVHRIIQRHGGEAWATGEVGKGATFCFTLESILPEG